MTGEAVRDSGNAEDDKSGGGEVADTLKALHETIRGRDVAVRYPSSGDQPARISMLHIGDTDEYTFIKVFDDKSVGAKYYEVKVDGEQVELSARTMMTYEEIEEKGAVEAENWMKLQDSLGLSLPSEEDELDFSNCVADFLKAAEDGTVEMLDTRGMSEPA